MEAYLQPPNVSAVPLQAFNQLALLFPCPTATHKAELQGPDALKVKAGWC